MINYKGDEMIQIYDRRMLINKIVQYLALIEDAQKLVDCFYEIKSTNNEFESSALQEKAQRIEDRLLKNARRLIQMYSNEKIIVKGEVEYEDV